MNTGIWKLHISFMILIITIKNREGNAYFALIKKIKITSFYTLDVIESNK